MPDFDTEIIPAQDLIIRDREVPREIIVRLDQSGNVEYLDLVYIRFSSADPTVTPLQQTLRRYSDAKAKIQPALAFLNALAKVWMADKVHEEAPPREGA